MSMMSNGRLLDVTPYPTTPNFCQEGMNIEMGGTRSLYVDHLFHHAILPH